MIIGIRRSTSRDQLFFFNDTATTEIYTLSLHDALPIYLPIIIPTQDSVGEYKVQTNNQGAEWGKFSGGIVNLSTKSGTNSWHGSAYEYFRNKVLNTNEYFHKNFELTHGQKNEPPP